MPPPIDSRSNLCAAHRNAVDSKGCAASLRCSARPGNGWEKRAFEIPIPDALVDFAPCTADARALAERRYATLSGGEQQRVQFARVLVQLLARRSPGEYRVLFLDEPTASLDPRHQIALLQAVSGLIREQGVAALVVLHDVNLAATWCDRLLLLAHGRSVALDTPGRALRAANLQVVYDMPAKVLQHPARSGVPLVLFG